MSWDSRPYYTRLRIDPLEPDSADTFSMPFWEMTRRFSR